MLHGVFLAKMHFLCFFVHILNIYYSDFKCINIRALVINIASCTNQGCVHNLKFVNIVIKLVFIHRCSKI